MNQENQNSAARQHWSIDQNPIIQSIRTSQRTALPPAAMATPRPIPRIDPKSRRMSAFLSESAYGAGDNIRAGQKQEYADTAIELLNRIAAVAFELEMRLPKDDNFVIGAEQQEKIEELRGYVETGNIPHVALNIHVMKQTKRLVERLENSVHALAQCDTEAYCNCQLPLYKEADNSLSYDMDDLVGGISIQEYLTLHEERMEDIQTSTMMSFRRGTREQVAMANAFQGLDPSFKSCIRSMPKTRSEFLMEWGTMWSTRGFKNILHKDLKSMKQAAAQLAKRKCPGRRSWES